MTEKELRPLLLEAYKSLWSAGEYTRENATQVTEYILDKNNLEANIHVLSYGDQAFKITITELEEIA